MPPKKHCSLEATFDRYNSKKCLQYMVNNLEKPIPQLIDAPVFEGAPILEPIDESSIITNS